MRRSAVRARHVAQTPVTHRDSRFYRRVLFQEKNNAATKLPAFLRALGSALRKKHVPDREITFLPYQGALNRRVLPSTAALHQVGRILHRVLFCEINANTCRSTSYDAHLLGWYHVTSERTKVLDVVCDKIMALFLLTDSVLDISSISCASIPIASVISALTNESTSYMSYNTTILSIVRWIYTIISCFLIL